MAPLLTPIEKAAKLHFDNDFYTLQALLPEYKSATSMTYVNKLLLCEPVKSTIFAKLGVDPALKFPTFPDHLLYGFLSHFVLKAEFDELCLSTLDSPIERDFFSGLYHFNGIPIRNYNPVDALAGRKIESTLDLGYACGGGGVCVYAGGSG